LRSFFCFFTRLAFVDRLHALGFLRACDPIYRALTFTLVGLPPTEYISLLLDIFGSFLQAFGRQATTVYLGQGADIVMQSCAVPGLQMFE
jgi:hypothetical protein